MPKSVRFPTGSALSVIEVDAVDLVVGGEAVVGEGRVTIIQAFIITTTTRSHAHDVAGRVAFIRMDVCTSRVPLQYIMLQSR